uniref:Ubiquitin-like domain-containing protein n=1 Tax=Zosterops lateralis melanops TaxID=1220523 RepID=A0A8D2Q0W6_ZOSLA
LPVTLPVAPSNPPSAPSAPSLPILCPQCKLELVVGSPASCMELELFGAEDEPLGALDCDEALLGSYPVTDGCRVHVTDRSGARAGQFEDLSQVAKYEMAESDYDKRTEPLCSWGLWDPEGEWEQDQGWHQRVPVPKCHPAMPPVSPRDSEGVLGGPGETSYLLSLTLLSLPSPSVGGRRYFECPPKFGAFVKPQSVTAGDFPPEDDGLDEL